MNTRAVALLAGGHASEHEVSLESGRTLLAALLEAGRSVVPVLIGTDGQWNLHATQSRGDRFEWPERIDGRAPAAEACGNPLAIASQLVARGVRVCVLGLHGRGGEDGVLQGFLEMAGLGYTGPGLRASAVAIDKLMLKRLLRSQELPTPAFATVEARDAGDLEAVSRSLCDRLGSRVVVKAPDLGSSVDILMADGPRELLAALSRLLVGTPRVLVERCVAGREFTVAVLGRAGRARALPVIEIVPRHGSWFDYDSKYSDGEGETEDLAEGGAALENIVNVVIEEADGTSPPPSQPKEEVSQIPTIGPRPRPPRPPKPPTRPLTNGKNRPRHPPRVFPKRPRLLVNPSMPSVVIERSGSSSNGDDSDNDRTKKKMLIPPPPRPPPRPSPPLSLMRSTPEVVVGGPRRLTVAGVEEDEDEIEDEDGSSWRARLNEGFRAIVAKVAPVASGLALMSAIFAL